MKDQISCQSLVQRRHCSPPAQELTQMGESCTCCFPRSTTHTHPDSSVPQTLPAALHIWMSLAGALPEAPLSRSAKDSPKVLGLHQSCRPCTYFPAAPCARGHQHTTHLRAAGPYSVLNVRSWAGKLSQPGALALPPAVCGSRAASSAFLLLGCASSN